MEGARSLTAFDSPESLAVVIVVQPGLRVGVVMLLTLAPVDAPAGEEPHQLQEAQAEKYPSIAGELAQMNDLYTRKLWHQLTLLVGSVAAMEGAAPLLQPLYDTFVVDFKHKMNKLALARVQIAVARQMPDAERAFFCKTAAATAQGLSSDAWSPLPLSKNTPQETEQNLQK